MLLVVAVRAVLSLLLLSDESDSANNKAHDPTTHAAWYNVHVPVANYMFQSAAKQDHVIN